MDIFEQIRHNINLVSKDLDFIIIKSVVEEKDSIIDLNVNQVRHGIDSEGGQLGEYASDEYAQMKQALGSLAPFGHVDLHLEGDYLSELTIAESLSEGFPGVEFESLDEKAEKLERKYDYIYGIAPENIPELEDITTENIEKNIIDELTRT